MGKVKDFIKDMPNHKGLMFILFILLTQLTMSSIQLYRYDYDNFCCRHMASDCEEFFEGLGITTYQVSGWNGDNGHVWLLLDFGWFTIPFESTALMLGYDPTFWRGYTETRISEGYISNGRINYELEWTAWL